MDQGNTARKLGVAGWHCLIARGTNGAHLCLTPIVQHCAGGLEAMVEGIE